MTSDTTFSSTIKTLVWFRQDLRLHDNPALIDAANNGAILPVYILDDINAEQWRMGAASRSWLHHSLTALNDKLQGNLLVLSGDASTIIPELCHDHACTSVVWNRCYEPWRIKRDTNIKASLKSHNIAVKSFNGSLLWEPTQVLKSDGTPYKVFTPYYRKGCLRQLEPRAPEPSPTALQFIKVDKKYHSCVAHQGINDLNLLSSLGWDKGFYPLWQPGEDGAEKQLLKFKQQSAFYYKDRRDFPSITGTSHLSPHLHFGEISINRIWHGIFEAAQEQGINPFDDSNLDCYLSELGWREFSYYLLYHFPYIPEQNHQPKFNAFPWQRDQQSLERWQQGLTGYPIIDAGMRELWQTGYMHNRVRMIVGSFLVKNLLIDWREGEQWFWDCLLDADLASNAASWQWVAGSGADASPYFRIFNPVTQGKKFDPEGEYVKRFVPELSRLPKKYIHSPWEASSSELKLYGITLGQSYPSPIVDLSTSRKRALEALEICQNK
ncbi:cryptochrome/photolyase family protein [Alteromonas sp. a30]|uniref:cryptochrome/photolyase family protein n=1 Tax=Alteromonas sp. a30 TaxID=2730917 RepID=UPI00227F050D|nr:deoxyribodipyrimidine photo-lyase [Alteromonas sp. a30]MCY7295750.1 deoxyribodipyrimidine photo-lyase [Alteromonas sp. a30]